MEKVRAINENRDFKRAYAKGKCIVSPSLVTYVIKNRFGENRTGITAGKKAGNAVHRSRARRIIRAAFGFLREKTKQGYDIVFVARAKTRFVKTQDVLREMEYHLKKLGLLT